MNYFNDENTTGYSQEELDRMNEMLSAKMAEYDPENTWYEQDLKNQAEKVLEIYNKINNLLA